MTNVNVPRSLARPAHDLPRAGPPLRSPEIEKDGVTFRFKAARTNEVQLLGQWSHGRPIPMTRDENDVWSVKVKALPAGVWEYHFSVNGRPALDPLNPAIKPQRELSANILHITANPPAPWDEQDVPQGALHSHSYFSKTLGYARHLTVYTPPGYQGKSAPLPVLYLAHGFGDNERTWTTHGKAHWMADALIAAGKATAMVIVMPDAHALPQKAMGVRDFVRNTADFLRDFRAEVRPFIEKTYRVRKDAEHRAFAGLSMGGRHALALALNHPDEFAWIAAFSPAPLSQKETRAALAAPVRVANSLRLFAISIGRDDFILPELKPFLQHLKNGGITPAWSLTGGDHSWPVWRRYLADLLPKLFR